MRNELSKLEQLDYKAQLTFAYLTCKRLYPNYVYFSKNYNFGNTAPLNNSLIYICDVLLDSENENYVREHFSLIETNTPSPEKFHTVLASSALDACTAIMETLEFIIDKKFRRILDISTFATDSVDMYIQERDDLDYNLPTFEQKIQDDPLMQKEISIQKGIINYLIKIKSIQREDITTLLSLQGDNGNLDLE